MENIKERQLVFTLKTNITEYDESIFYHYNEKGTFYKEVQGCVEKEFENWYYMMLDIAYILENETMGDNRYSLWGNL